MTTVRDGATIHDIPAEDVFFSTTDRKGVIFQANDMFVRMARRDRNQLVGAPHSIIRHPDMPAGAFHLLWNRLLDGEPVAAYVLNQAGDGSAYWAFGTIAPLGSGFLSVRCRPTRLDLFAAADGFGQQFAAAVQPPVLRRAGSEIYPHAAFVARAVQYDAVFFSGQVEAGSRWGIGDSQCGMAGVVGQGVRGGGDERDGGHGGLGVLILLQHTLSGSLWLGLEI